MKKQFITEAKRLQKLAGIITESQYRELNENLNLNNLPPDLPAMGALWRLTTPEDDYSSEYMWIEDNVKSLLTQLYKSLGEDDDEGIDEVTSSITYDMSPTDYNIDGTVQEFLQGFKNSYEKFGL
jgi:hypothetical protein